MQRERCILFIQCTLWIALDLAKQIWLFKTILIVKNDNKMLISSNSGSYYQTRVNTFSEFISNITGTLRMLFPNNTTYFSRAYIKQYIFRELLANNTTYFSRTYIKQYWQIQRVTGKQYHTLFRSLHQTILTFSESSFQIKL